MAHLATGDELGNPLATRCLLIIPNREREKEARPGTHAHFVKRPDPCLFSAATIFFPQDWVRRIKELWRSNVAPLPKKETFSLSLAERMQTCEYDKVARDLTSEIIIISRKKNGGGKFSLSGPWMDVSARPMCT